MAEKRRFYNTGDAKGFTKAKFFEAVKELAETGDITEVEDASIGLIIEACEYELETLAMRSKAGTGEKKDAMQSDYAQALAKAIIPLVSSTPMTTTEILEVADSKGIVSPKGTPFAAPWVSRVLSSEIGANAGIVKVQKVVEKTDSKGLKSQKEVSAYKRG